MSWFARNATATRPGPARTHSGHHASGSTGAGDIPRTLDLSTTEEAS